MLKNAAKTRKLLYLSEFFFFVDLREFKASLLNTDKSRLPGLHKDVVTNKQQSNEYRVCHEAYVSQ